MTSTSTGSADPAGGSGAATDVGGTAPPTGRPIRPTLSPTSAVVAGLAVPGLDLRTPRAVVDARAGRRIRFRRSVLGGCAAIAVIGLAVAVFPRGEPDGVVADADSTTSTSAPDTTVPADTVPVAAAAAPPTTAKAVTTTTAKPVTTLPPPTTVPPPTLPANQPMTASLQALTPKVEAGNTARVQLTWSDPDFADPLGPAVSSVWGDPEVGLPISGDTRAPCEQPGAGGSGTQELKFRFSQPGDYTVSVEVAGCAGQGAYGESVTLTTVVRVDPPTGSRVVVAAANVAGRSPDSAVATFTPTGGAAVALPTRDPDLRQIGAGAVNGPVTVLRVPAGDGVLQLQWDAGTCASAPLGASTATVTLAQTACAATTGSTVP